VISPTRFYNFYDWGGLKGDPRDMLRRYFDLFIYTGSGGTRWGMLRRPSGSIEPTRWRAYLHQQRGLRPPARRTSFVTRGGVAILTFGPPEPGGVSGLSSTGGAEELDDEEGWSAPLALLRADLLGGDLRGLYLMWLASVQAGERRPVEREPLMPPGLAHLTGTLYRVAEFLRLDPGLLSVALSGWKAAPRTAEALPLEQARTLDWTRMKNLLLVAEVLSPSSARADRFTKRIEYQRQGIPLYWVVDPEQQQVEVWTPEGTAPHLERERLVWHPSGATRPFDLELEALFRPI
jgi:hypothetical protein